MHPVYGHTAGCAALGPTLVHLAYWHHRTQAVDVLCIRHVLTSLHGRRQQQVKAKQSDFSQKQQLQRLTAEQQLQHGLHGQTAGACMVPVRKTIATTTATVARQPAAAAAAAGYSCAWSKEEHEQLTKLTRLVMPGVQS